MKESGEIAAEKARLRERFQAARLAMPPAVRARASRAICERVLALPEIDAIGHGRVALFWPRVDRAEVDVRPLADALRSRGATTVLPRITGPGQLTWHDWHGEPLVEGRWGVCEPAATALRADPTDLAAIIIPGLAFGADGTRLGWGGGYYDRALGRGGVAIGVTFDVALVGALPEGPYDRRVGIVVSETRVAGPDA